MQESQRPGQGLCPQHGQQWGTLCLCVPVPNPDGGRHSRGAGRGVVGASWGAQSLAAGIAAPTAAESHLRWAVRYDGAVTWGKEEGMKGATSGYSRTPCAPKPRLTSGTVLFAGTSTSTAVTAAAASTSSPAGLDAGGPGLGSIGPTGGWWGHSLGIGGGGARVVARSWAGLGAQGTWRCCWGRGPIVARGGAQS